MFSYVVFLSVFFYVSVITTKATLRKCEGEEEKKIYEIEASGAQWNE